MASKYQTKVGGPTDLRIFYRVHRTRCFCNEVWSRKVAPFLNKIVLDSKDSQLSNPFLNGLCMALSTFLLHLICSHMEIALFSFVTGSKCENKWFAKLNFHLIGFHQAWYFQDNTEFSEKWSLVGVFQHCISTSVLLRTEWVMVKTRSSIPGGIGTPTSPS